MNFLRWFIGRLVLFIDWLTRPRGIRRDPETQRSIDAQTAGLILYQFEACPFCVKVRRAMRRHSLTIQTRDARRDARARQELLDGGGRVKVPCLRIVEENEQVRWLYESSDIVRYLEQRFAA